LRLEGYVLTEVMSQSHQPIVFETVGDGRPKPQNRARRVEWLSTSISNRS
jgi:hypothetical protein